MWLLSLALIYASLTTIAICSPPNLEKGHHNPDANGDCETVMTTVTLAEPSCASSTFVYRSTVVVPGAQAQTVTKVVASGNGHVFETEILTGQTETITIFASKTLYPKATTTSISTSTYTTFPNAVTSTTSTETLMVYVQGTLTVTFPAVLSINSFYRYTGAPTSLWLSVI